jgi:GT2 family glycosyltransferase
VSSGPQPAPTVARLAQSLPPQRAAWLSDSVLLLTCAGDGEGDGELFTGFRELPLEAGGRVELSDSEGSRFVVEAHEVEAKLTDLATFLRDGPAGWDASTRTRLLDSLVALGAEYGLSASLSEGLRQVREALRERRPHAIEDRRTGRGVVVERLHRIDERRFYVRGRAWDETGPLATLTAVSPEGERVELRELACPLPAGEGGFAATFETAAPSRGADGWLVEAGSSSERAVEVRASLSPDPLYTLFADAALEFTGAEELRERHIRPAVARLNELRRGGVEIAEIVEYGRVPEAPAVSLVVPLQRRVDLIEHQILQFAADPEIEDCDLLFVLDEPEQRDQLEQLGDELFALYGLPFRLATLNQAAGLPTACELGASLARPRRVVFLGADVLPDRPGWLRALAAAFEADSAVAAATPKLLYADEAIDQAGLEYGWASCGGTCLVRPRLRGLHRSVTAAAEGATVAAASLACLMVDADQLEAVGGLSGEFGLSEYEGSDLARRLAAAGRQVRYAPGAELYRLDGLGVDHDPGAEPYARWLHSRLWSETIAEALT